MKLIGIMMLATMIVPSKLEIETVTGGVFFVDAWYKDVMKGITSTYQKSSQ